MRTSDDMAVGDIAFDCGFHSAKNTINFNLFYWETKIISLKNRNRWKKGEKKTKVSCVLLLLFVCLSVTNLKMKWIASNHHYHDQQLYNAQVSACVCVIWVWENKNNLKRNWKIEKQSWFYGFFSLDVHHPMYM